MPATNALSVGAVYRSFRFLNMTLMLGMTLCLMVYITLEHCIQQAQAWQVKTFSGQSGKPAERPTARWVFPLLAEAVLNLNTPHRTLPTLLGKRYLYANSG